MEAGAAYRFRPRLALPSVGDRFGELTVVGIERGPGGGNRGILVRCSCGADSHKVEVSNLRSGKSTRCWSCAQRAARKTRKSYLAYDDVVPDEGHRRRLLNRIAACIQRCTNKRAKGYPNYGGRGITVHWGSDRRAFLEYLVSIPGWNDPTLELDRVDVDRGYEPGNLRFVTRTVNAGNRRKTQKMQARISRLEREVEVLRARVRYYALRAKEPVHDPFE